MLGFIPDRCSCGRDRLIVLGASDDVPDGVALALRVASVLGAELVIPVEAGSVACPVCGVAQDWGGHPVVRVFEVLALVESSLSPRRGPLN
jgi:hypothetical protein